jgi:hypothetical protein
MEPESSMLHSREPAVGQYFKPYESSPQPHRILLRSTFNIILSTMTSPSVFFFHQVYLIKPCVHSSPMLAICLDHANNIWRTVKSQRPHYAVFSSLLYNFTHLWSKYSPQHPVLQHLQSIISLNIRDQVSNPEETTKILWFRIFQSSCL